MGTDKATLVVEGVAMAERVAGALRTAGATEVFAVGGDEGRLSGLGLRTVADDRPGEGPLAATITALRAATADVVAVLSCDLLAPSPEVIADLVGRLAAATPAVVGVVPVVDEQHQWTHAVWRAAALPLLEARQVAGDRSLRRAAAALPLLTPTDLDPAAVADADAPEDLGGGTART